ncbi:uncharacterized protein HKW66_Vig0250410 [Vigna angularis]|uniref:Uncharacterized protein n=1 Tax=Phaseolus angularis TaxID=3914 RepID=A0A8T0KTN7_PHAAN|nr:uncharacterized protein HKW66_Vig0250410 [Vigna angularis]
MGFHDIHTVISSSFHRGDPDLYQLLSLGLSPRGREFHKVIFTLHSYKLLPTSTTFTQCALVSLGSAFCLRFRPPFPILICTSVIGMSCEYTCPSAHWTVRVGEEEKEVRASLTARRNETRRKEKDEDVYFPLLVKLRQDIYDLQEEENLDLEMSSPHNSGFEAAFKGNPKILNDSTSNGCDVNSNETKSKSNGWSDWGLGANKTGQANTKSNDGCEVTLKCAAHRVARLRSSGCSIKMLSSISQNKEGLRTYLDGL